MFSLFQSPYAKFLSPEQQQQVMSQSLLGLGAGLLGSTGPSTTPISFGQQVSAGLQGFMGGQQQATASALMQRDYEIADEERETEKALKAQKAALTQRVAETLRSGGDLNAVLRDPQFVAAAIEADLDLGDFGSFAKNLGAAGDKSEKRDLEQINQGGIQRTGYYDPDDPRADEFGFVTMAEAPRWQEKAEGAPRETWNTLTPADEIARFGADVPGVYQASSDGQVRQVTGTDAAAGGGEGGGEGGFSLANQRTNDEIDEARRTIGRLAAERGVTPDQLLAEVFQLDPLSGMMVEKDPVLAATLRKALDRKYGDDPEHASLYRAFYPSPSMAPEAPAAQPVADEGGGWFGWLGPDSATATPTPVAPIVAPGGAGVPPVGAGAPAGAPVAPLVPPTPTAAPAPTGAMSGGEALAVRGANVGALAPTQAPAIPLSSSDPPDPASYQVGATYLIDGEPMVWDGRNFVPQ